MNYFNSYMWCFTWSYHSTKIKIISNCSNSSMNYQNNYEAGEVQRHFKSFFQNRRCPPWTVYEYKATICHTSFDKIWKYFSKCFDTNSFLNGEMFESTVKNPDYKGQVYLKLCIYFHCFHRRILNAFHFQIGYVHFSSSWNRIHIICR